MKFKSPCPHPKLIGPQPHSSVWVLLSMAAFSLRQRGQTVAADIVRPTKPKSFVKGSCGERWPTHDLTLKTWTCTWCTPEFASPDVFRSQTHGKNGWNTRCIHGFVLDRALSPQRHSDSTLYKALCQPDNVCVQEAWVLLGDLGFVALWNHPTL